jgi:hypothetical protein
MNVVIVSGRSPDLSANALENQLGQRSIRRQPWSPNCTSVALAAMTSMSLSQEPLLLIAGICTRPIIKLTFG